MHQLAIALARALLLIGLTLAVAIPVAMVFWPFLSEPLWQRLGLSGLSRPLRFWGPPLVCLSGGIGLWWLLEVVLAPRLPR